MNDLFLKYKQKQQSIKWKVKFHVSNAIASPDCSAKVIVSIREVLLLYELHAFFSRMHAVGRLLFIHIHHYKGGLFKLENATTLVF